MDIPGFGLAVSVRPCNSIISSVTHVVDVKISWDNISVGPITGLFGTHVPNQELFHFDRASEQKLQAAIYVSTGDPELTRDMEKFLAQAVQLKIRLALKQL